MLKLRDFNPVSYLNLMIFLHFDPKTSVAAPYHQNNSSEPENRDPKCLCKGNRKCSSLLFSTP